MVHSREVCRVCPSFSLTHSTRLGPYWDDVSEDAKNFIDQLLVVDPDERPSAEDALKHPWLTKVRRGAGRGGRGGRLQRRSSRALDTLQAKQASAELAPSSKLKQFREGALRRSDVAHQGSAAAAAAGGK